MTASFSSLGRSGKRSVVVLLGIAIGVWLLWPQPTDRESLDLLVAQAKHGFESKSVSEIMDCVAPGYEDESGLTRADVSRICQRVARQAKQVEITITGHDITVQSPKATGHFDVVAVLDLGTETITWPMRLEVQFMKQRRGWSKLWRQGWVVVSVNGHGLDKQFEDLL